MSGECVFGCRHPQWGGAGECITADDPAVDDSCECDAGYVSRDSFGSPSCVPLRVLVGVFTTVALVQTAMLAVLLWHLAHHFIDLTESARHARKAVVRLRFIISSSICVGGMLVAFCVAMAEGGSVPLWDRGGYFIMYGLSFPGGFFSIIQVAEMWLDHLPSQLVKTGSTLAQLKALGKERNLFLWGGFATSGGAVVISVLSLVFGRREIARVLHLIMGVAAMIAGIGVASVTTFLTRAINRASAQSPQPWHKRAKRNIWMEASGLIAAGVVFAISVGFLELTHRGGGTPLIPLAAMVISGSVAQAAVAHNSKPTAGGRSATSPGFLARPSTIASTRPSMIASFSPAAFAVKVSAQVKKVMCDGSESGDLIPIGTPIVLSGTLKGTESTTGRAGKNKVIPADSEDFVVPLVVERSGGESLAKSCSPPR